MSLLSPVRRALDRKIRKSQSELRRRNIWGKKLSLEHLETRVVPTISVDFRQAANFDAPNTIGDIHWINSIVQASNSVYLENMSVAQRLVADSIPSTSGNLHSLTFNVEATKGGTHAYDWLTSYDQAIATAPASVFTAGYNLNPTGPESDGLTAVLTSLRATPRVAVDVPDDPFQSAEGGDTNLRIAAYEAQFGNRTVGLYGNAPITGAHLSLSHDVANLGDTGDSFITYTLSWTSSSTQILLEMGGHLAVSGNQPTNPIAWTPTTGASQVNGGPYHFKMNGAIDGISIGSQDNQVKGADVLVEPGHIIVDKVTNPSGDPTSFTFNTTGTDYVGFSLTDAAAPNDQTLPAGTYSVAELVPAGWSLSNLVIDDPTTDSSSAGATATLKLAGGETIHVTFTDTKLGKIIVDKVTNPSGDPTSFHFNTTGTGYTDGFNLTDAATPDDSGFLAAGIYSVAEVVPAGWTLTSAVADDGSPVSALDLQAGETIHVAFTDTKDATVTVVKNTIGGDGTFSFASAGALAGLGTPAVPNPVSVTTASNTGSSPTFTFANLAAAGSTLSFAEMAKAGWSFTSLVITGGSADDTSTGDAASLMVQPGENIVVTYTDTKLGTVTVVKHAVPNAAQDFNFSGTLGAFSLDDDADPTLLNTNLFTDLLPGTYTIVEAPSPSGWSLTSLVKTEDAMQNSTTNVGTRTATVVLEAGENATVTFTNTFEFGGTVGVATAIHLVDGATNPVVPINGMTPTNSTVFDVATITASPDDLQQAITGSVTFKLWLDIGVIGDHTDDGPTPQFTSTNPVGATSHLATTPTTAVATAQSNNFGPLGTGNYYFTSEWSETKDVNFYLPPGGVKSGPAEPFQTALTLTTATIGFWQNQNGIAVIKNMGVTVNPETGKTVSSVGYWLATQFPNLYSGLTPATGYTFTASLADDSADQVLSYFKYVFTLKDNAKAEAQVMSVAFAAFVTDAGFNTTPLGIATATKYGFVIVAGGLSGQQWNVGPTGSILNSAATPVLNNTTYSIGYLLAAANNKAVGGRLFAGSAASRSAVDSIFGAINEFFDI
jgi:hypothetical protein